jgi:CRISPR-associated protein Csc3
VFQTDVLKQVVQGFEEGTKVHIVVKSFAETMLGRMIERYSLYPAKGTTVARFAHNPDQMMLTHVLNGLFPTLILLHEAQRRNLARLSRLEVDEIKLYVLAYSMHDLDKILGESLSTMTSKAVAEARQKLIAELEKLNVEAFLPDFGDWASEILWLAVNTQRSRDINLSHYTFTSHEAMQITDGVLEAFRPQTGKFRTRVEPTLRDLCTFSDLIAYFVKSPEDALLSNVATRRGDGLLELMSLLTDNQFTLAYHKFAEVRGFLSNQINNATMRYLQNIYPEGQEQLIPYLYFPNGVVYLDPQRRAAPIINQDAVHEAVRTEIQDACRDSIKGLGFNHLGLLKYPRYYHDFLSPGQFLELFIKTTLSEDKATVAENTLQRMKEMQAGGSIPIDIALDYTPNNRIAILGRFLINYTRLVEESLGETVPHLKAYLERQLVQRFGEEIWNKAEQIPSLGGLDYRFYWLAAQYLDTHPLAVYEVDSPDASLEELFNELVHELLQVAGKELEAAAKFQGPYLQDLPDYLKKNLSFGFGATPLVEDFPDFAGELSRYAAAKKARQSELGCTICNSAYPIRKQEDASVLFQPWVYKNRLPLYNSENAGGICSICSLELMLRQVLLKDKPGNEGRVKTTGRGYEKLELKYFFLYPDYFFTNQTYHLVDYIIRRMHNLKLYEVCEVVRDRETIQAADLLNLSFFNLAEVQLRAIKRKERDEQKEQEEKGSMYLFDRYEKKQFPGFIFFAKKVFAKSSGAAATVASWVEATWLGLALPLITGAKVVVSESYLPLYNSSIDFMETVVLDAPHQSVRYLLPASSARLRLDQLYGARTHQSEGNWIGGMLAAFSRAIEMHIDTEREGGDLRLERFPRIARNLETDQLFVFSFLQEQVRRKKLDQITGKRASHYNSIYHQFITYYYANEGEIMDKIATRHERITDLYLKFYSPFSTGSDRKWPNSHAIVRPIDIAAKSIIKDTLNLTGEEIKLEMAAALRAWLEIVRKGGATGRAIAHPKEQDRLVQEFVEAFYNEIFLGYAQGQRSILNSRLNRLKNACENVFLMRVRERSQQDRMDQQEEGEKSEEQLFVAPQESK